MARMPAHERARILIACADRLVAEREELARMLAEENGKPIRQTREEVDAAARIIRGFGEEAKRLFGRQVPMDAVPGAERHRGHDDSPAHRRRAPPSPPSTIPSSCTRTRWPRRSAPATPSSASRPATVL